MTVAAPLDLKDSQVVLLEENYDSRALIKSALRGLGCRAVHECKTVEDVRHRLRYFSVDLLILDLDTNFEPTRTLIRDIRYQRLGFSWFVVIVGLTWKPMKDVIEGALAAGMDDLVKKPLTNRILIDRLSNLIRNRKTFVAGPDYIGPERAEGVLPKEQMEAQVEVPNSLREKVTGTRSPADDATTFKQVMQDMNRQRLHSLTVEIGGRARKVVERLRGGESIGAFEVEISRLAGLTAQVETLASHEIVKNLPHLAASMAKAMADISGAGVATLRRFEIFHLHVQAIAAALRGDVDGVDDVASVLSAAVEVARKKPAPETAALPKTLIERR